MTGGGFTGEVPLDTVQEAFSKMELENMKILWLSYLSHLGGSWHYGQNRQKNLGVSSGSGSLPSE